MKKLDIFALCVCSLLLGCSSESSIDVSSNHKDACDCSEGQVCFNKTCYDADSECAKCEEGQVCVGDKCYDADSPCAECKKSQVCVNSTCYSAKDPCAKCKEGQICANSVCYDKGDPCSKCKDGQVCVNSTCYEKGNPCSKCEEGQVCQKEKCYDADDPCLKCEDAQVCKSGECVDPEDPCEACAPSDSCEDGKCIPCANEVCGTYCCDVGEICDAFGEYCSLPCDDGRPVCGDDCCESDMFCSEAGYCDRKCDSGSSCGLDRECCSEEQQCLEDKYCAPKCDAPRILCGAEKQEVCCQEGEVCLNGECHASCAENTTRCGADQNMCCNNADQICIFNQCLKRGADCTKNEDCELWEFCDLEGTKTCVSQDANNANCIYKPSFEKFEPVVKWHYKDAEVCGTPAVADMTGDGVPNVVFENEKHELVALDGDTGAVLATTKVHAWHPWGDIALADIDNDKVVEALVSTGEIGTNKSGMGILVLKKVDGKWTWVEKGFLKIEDNLLSSNVDNSNSLYYADIHPSVADIDADGIPEVVTAVGVMKGNDLTKWQCKLNIPSYLTWYRYGIVIADLDQDGQSELIADKIYNNKCEVLADISESGWGFPAIADVVPNNNKAGELVPEIVRSGNGSVSAWKVYKNGNVWTQEQVWKVAHPGGGGGHPNISDFDGDKKAEIGIAGADYYAVFKGADGSVLWHTKTQDHSSQRTGSSVFDFEGDGKAEVVYRDECYLRVYNGATGDVIMEEPVTSGTVIEYPLIVDVDADGKTEIITTSDSLSCPYPESVKPIGVGVIAYKDSHSKWVRTRKVWNQHAYHVTNINEDGTVPKNESANWLNKRLNNYRANTQPDDAFNAPNLKPSDLKLEQNCPNYRLTATVRNEGSSSAKNIWVSFYIRGYDTGTGKDDLLLGSVKTQGVIVPGGSLDVVFDWDLSGTLVKSGTSVKKVDLPQQISFSVDDAPGQNTADFYNECVEDDNDSEAKKAEACPVA